MASSSALVLSDDAAADYSMIESLVVPGDPDSSELLLYASGQTDHDGGTILSQTSAEYQTLAAWVAEGALNN